MLEIRLTHLSKRSWKDTKMDSGTWPILRTFVPNMCTDQIVDTGDHLSIAACFLEHLLTVPERIIGGSVTVSGNSTSCIRRL
jgi:hypothetical protein